MCSLLHMDKTNELIELGDRVTDGEISGNVTRCGKDRVLVRHWGQGLQAGERVTHWFYRSSLTVLRKANDYREVA